MNATSLLRFAGLALAVTVAMATTEEDAATAQNLIIWADVAPTSFISLTPATPVNPSGWTLLSWTATVSWDRHAVKRDIICRDVHGNGQLLPRRRVAPVSCRRINRMCSDAAGWPFAR